MKFSDVIKYLEQMVNIELQPINSSNETLVILEVDHENSRYTVDKTSTTKKRTRTFTELQKILSELVQKGYVSVDQALNGSGSSRHQPETIFANLPFIEHFKYDKKKHLYLRERDTHDLGTLKELSPSESRIVKKKIDKYRDFDISQFYFLHRDQTLILKDKLESIFTKYPGESDVDSVREALESIQELEIKLSEAIVNIDLAEVNNSPNTDDDSIPFGADANANALEEDDGQGDIDTDLAIEVKGIVPTRITQISPTVSLLYDRVQHDEIDLTPEYQRKDRIWPLKDRARLIESILLGLPLPVFYFAERMNKDPNAEVDFDWVVIDGLQRTTTLVDFMKGDFSLKELTQLPKYNSFKFKDLPRKEQRKIREYQIQGHLIQVSSDSEEMIRELFHRINTYGKNLSYQEIRSALYPGSASRYCKYFVSEDVFLNGIPSNISGDRMMDVEYILRAISFLLLGYQNYSYKTNDDFLCQAMKTLNKYNYNVDKGVEESDKIFKEIDLRLRSALDSLITIFGKNAYKKDEGGKVNKVLFELLVATFAAMSDKQREILCLPEHSEFFRSRLWQAIDEDDDTLSNWESETYREQNRGFDYAISNSTGKRVTVKYRFDALEQILNEIKGLNFKFSCLIGSDNAGAKSNDK